MGKSKIKTSKDLKNKNTRTFKIKFCPKCESEKVKIILGEEKGNKWKCLKCGWKGENIQEKEMSEEKFLEYLNKLNKKSK